MILRTQTLWNFTGLNPQGFHSAPWNVTFNTTSSFVTNTNWQYYGGETTMSYFSQMAGLTVQNFLSAGVGIVVAVALIRGIVGRSGKSLGNFWQDLVRTVLYVLLPISFVVALVLVSQGVDPELLALPDGARAHRPDADDRDGAGRLAGGDQAARHQRRRLLQRQLGAPVREPDRRSRTSSRCCSVLIIPAALVFTYGRMAGNRRQGYAIYATMMVMFLGAVVVAYIAEAHGSPAQHAAGLHTHAIAGSAGGNLEGKEQRFGIAGSALFDVVTTVTSCGAVNSAIESFTGIGGAVPFANLSASEVIFGGVGTGLYSILLYVLLAVFIGGLMVGPHARVPRQEDRGAGDQARRARDPDHAAGGAVLAPRWRPPASAGPRVDLRRRRQGPQGFSETFYAYLSQANNNGSAFAGYTGFIQPNAGNLGSHGVTFADLLGGFDDAVRALRADPVRARGRRRARRQARQPRRASARCAPTTPRSWCC